MEQNFKISDAIPEAPASFDARVEDTLRSVCTQQNVRAQKARPIRFNKKVWIAIAVAATLLITTTAVAARAIWRLDYTPGHYMMQDPNDREPIPDVENAIASAKPENVDCTIVMLPEMKEADELNEWRVSKGQPVYSEADWGWIREIRPEVQEVLVDGNLLVFNIKLCTDHGASFGINPNQEQMVDALCDDAYFTTEDGQICNLPGLGTGVNPAYVTPDGAILYTDSELEFAKIPFPTEGKVRITAEIGIRDARVADMGFAGLLAKITYTFTFDASAGADVAEPCVSERALSGSCTLTYYGMDEHEYNKTVSLDGVVLEETVCYRSTGIYVTYRVKSAPEGWTDADSAALLFPSKEHNWYGLSVAVAPIGSTDEKDVIRCGYPDSWESGEYTCILPVFPSDYEKTKAKGYELRLSALCIGAVNSEPVGDDWYSPAPDTEMYENYEYEMREQPIAAFPLPLP